MNTDTIFSSKSDEWETPKELFDKLDSEYHFTLDPCATDENHLCEKYYTIKDDGLSKSWANETVFVNPPYGRKIGKWVKKCYEEHQEHGATIVMLIPSRTDTRWFHNYIYHKANIEFIKGRLKFANKLYELNGSEPTSAPFPSMIIVYK